MTIKELAYSAQQILQASTGSSLKRAHIYELMAASFGLNSYAAFGVDTVLTQRGPDDDLIASDIAFVRRRCIELGYPPEIAELVSVSLGSFLAERHIGIVRISALISQLREDRWEAGGEGDFEPLMLDGLEVAASKGNALAHYALALIYAPDRDEYTGHGTGSSYWHSQEQQGRVLTGVEKEWADAYSAQLTLADKYTNHLREAGRLGSQHALLDLAEKFGDPSFFDLPRHDFAADPSAVAEIAERLGRVADAKHWLCVAAESGDTRAMLRLIEEYDQGDLTRSWIWVYLSRLVGTDLSKDDHYAINEEGSEYDDDIGGPAYTAGRDGIDLAPLTAEQDAAAKDAAQDLFDQIQRVAAQTHRR